MAVVAVAEVLLALCAHRWDPVLRWHAWLALAPPVAAQATGPGVGAAPVVAALPGAALAALFLVLLGDRTWAYLAWLPPACAAAAAAFGLLRRRFTASSHPAV